jgi:hypothetical protein
LRMSFLRWVDAVTLSDNRAGPKSTTPRGR